PMERFTRQAQEAMARTQAIVTQFGHATVEPEHLLLALLDNAGPVVDAVNWVTMAWVRAMASWAWRVKRSIGIMIGCYLTCVIT
ncbi:MAG: hypothetical protein EBY11_05605, partial [Proteobacteria bacterium]|nr:hypothetical protein [Pseudomonadota bacterium]